MRRLLPIVLAAGLAFIPVAHAQVPPPPPNAVATVDDSVIPKKTFDEWLGAQDATKAQVMSFLINSQWVRGEARRWGVDVTPEEVLRSFRRLRRVRFETRREYATSEGRG